MFPKRNVAITRSGIFPSICPVHSYMGASDSRSAMLTG